MLEKKTYQFKLKNRYKRKQLLIMAIILICMISLVIVFGRYITDSINNFFIRSKEFYFSSDKLSENTSVYQIDNWSGVSDYTIAVNMNSRKNNIEKATYDIGYEIEYTCTDNAVCQLNKTEGIIYSSTNSDIFNLTITPNIGLKTRGQSSGRNSC